MMRRSCIKGSRWVLSTPGKLNRSPIKSIKEPCRRKDAKASFFCIVERLALDLLGACIRLAKAWKFSC